MLDIQDIQCRKIREQSLHQAGVGTCALACDKWDFSLTICTVMSIRIESQGVYPIPFAD
ncbi:hypothetical protein VCSRO187_3314 [Vibrio cholerae]|nr:hypothetical protein VCSRO187_3314 [Vibrio cholerae]